MKSPATSTSRRASAWRERIAHLPRETRDTFFLLFAIAAAAGPHAAHLPLWCSALTVAMLAWRGWLAWRGQVLPGRWSLSAILVLVAALTFATHRTLLGREAGVTMLVMLMAMKTLELRARRDAFVVFFLGFFLVLTQYLYSQSLLTGLWTLLAIWALLTALVLAQMPIGQPSLRQAAGQALRSVAIGLPLMTLLFLLFPRIAPLWGVPSDAVGRSGLSNELQFGAMAEIANDDSVALRLRFVDGAAPPPQSLYFRGPVLAAFDGRSWRALASPPPGRQSALAPRGALRRYELTLEPLRIAVLPLLEMSPEPAGALLPLDGGLLLRRGAELQWIAPRPITERLRLSSSAALDYEAGVQATPLSLQPFLELPPGRNPRTLAWAAALRNEPRFAALEGPALAEALVGAVLQHLRSNEYIYTLAPGRYGENGQELVDEFWLDRRLGFCEHFASGFAVVMRALGIPARIVTGFQGADRELQDGYLVVRQSQAHAWTEVWIAGRGWLRADPTAAVAPERIASSLTLEAPPGVLAGAISQVNPALWRSLRRGWETLENRWQQTVLNYSRGDQFDLLKRMGWSRPDWAALGQAAAAVIATLTLGALGALAWQRRPHDPWQRLQARVLRGLAQVGVDAQAHQGPRQWAALLEQRHGPNPATGMLRALDSARYGHAGQGFDAAECRRWAGQIETALRRMPMLPRPGSR
jgi:transglutaminase-like putative cysteine protease